MAADFEMKQGDTLPVLEFTCRDANGPVDISTALTATVHVVKGGVVAVNAAATILDDGIDTTLKGKGKYAWAVIDTDTELGLYDFEVEVDWGGGKILTFPNGSKNPKLQINKQLA
jgi:hypothetical protein